MEAMEPVTMNEVMDIAQYERARPEFRAKVLEAKERRRVSVGPAFTFLFENHLTVLYQVQEMMRIERIVEEKAIAHEVATYNELIPPPGELGATLLIEYPDPAERKEALKALLGMERHVRLEVADLPPVPARFDTRQWDEDKVSSVQYVGFPLAAEHRAAWREAGLAGRVRLVVDHPAYRHEAVLTPDAVEALGEDLAD